MNDRMTVIKNGDTIILRVPMKIRRRSGRKWIEAPVAGQEPARPTSVKPTALVIAVTRAHCWQELLDEGRFKSISELAKALGVDSTYAARLLQLTLLAPDII